ncbi:MAG: geranylgeranylglyceryl/heptaprenylglyceryl phosphate synthase [Ignavibacteriales bacterium]|nr:MAG: geranylgeranylglyceryl/heptaprenylglyceryl phosphate synthase [Ignavibacteriales bacterium]
MKTYQYLQDTIAKKGAAFLILIDPDKLSKDKTAEFVKHCERSGVDGFLIGGSLLIDGNIYETVKMIKSNCSLPVITFPGGVEQITNNADALLFISVISGRNADQLIGKHVLAAPYIKKIGVETISTGYMLIESGKLTAAQYISNSFPIPRSKPEIAASTALAAEFMGMKLIYLEAGSGAEDSVPNEMVKLVSKTCSIPVIVGGGLKDAQTAGEKVQNGASIIVAGNHFEDESNWNKIKEFADAVHKKVPHEI